ncbi:hypothetical protein ACHAW5_009842 [Stephanodiscus triporus]|uniref:Uncharacterized protein n=1 Tax=Stephanodiscus triporus TaxID=2934178 RepID=A0ABD3NG58_9STRA
MFPARLSQAASNPASEILSRASRRSYRDVREDATIANAKRRTQKRGAQTIDLLSQGLCGPLRETVNTYERELRNMHPFEAVVMDLTVRARRKKDGLALDDLLAEIHDGRKELLRLSKDWIAKIKSSSSTKEAYDCTEEAKESIGRAFLDLIDGPWTGITELQRSLRNAPVVRLDCPAVVLVGAPNVGKSSIVRAISSGTPEVNNYPFTTRGVTLGHVRVFWESEREVALGNVAGIMDSPGVLRRDDGRSRNEMEELTLAAMAHLPTAVMYVMDLSGGAGDKCSSVEDQLVLRRELRARFPRRPWIDVVSKVDLGLVLRRELRARFPRRPWIDVVSKVDLGVVDGARERLAQILEAEGRHGGGAAAAAAAADRHFIELSIKEGQGVEELRQEVMRMLGEVRVVLDAMAASDERSARAV